MSCMAVGAAGQKQAAGFSVIVWPSLKSLLGPSVFCKLQSAWPEGQQPSPSRHWPSQPSALEKLVCCKTYLLRYGEKAILHLIISIWLWTDRSGLFVGKQSKKERDVYVYLLVKSLQNFVGKLCIAEIRSWMFMFCELNTLYKWGNGKVREG